MGVTFARARARSVDRARRVAHYDAPDYVTHRYKSYHVANLRELLRPPGRFTLGDRPRTRDAQVNEQLRDIGESIRRSDGRQLTKGPRD